MIRTLVALIALLIPSATWAAGGSLLIAGGAVQSSNAAIHRALLDGRPADAPTIAIIPSASGAPAQSAQSFAASLVRHGANAADIVVVQLAAENDPGTPDVDESLWADNAANPREIAKLTRAGAIWFTGGDQLRTTRLLLLPNGRDTPMLAVIRRRLAAGAIVGGSSAGAAIMSRTMITNGESIPAITQPVQWQTADDNRDELGTLVLADGLGFLPRGVVDQHFDARARLGRLTRALFELPVEQRVGFGVDEDTALRVRLADGRADVLGPGQVTVIDARRATRGDNPHFRASGISLSLLSAGDRVDTRSLLVTAADGRSPVNGSRDAPDLPDAGGLAQPAERVAPLLLDGLMQGSPEAKLVRSSFLGNMAIRFVFERTADSRAAAGPGPYGLQGSTISNVRMAIEPWRAAGEEQQ
jgi:cyanophycinase